MILVDKINAIMEQQTFECLPEYTLSLPTEQTIGKRWKCNRQEKNGNWCWWMGEYSEIHKKNNRIDIIWRRILIIK